MQNIHKPIAYKPVLCIAKAVWAAKQLKKQRFISNLNVFFSFIILIGQFPCSLWWNPFCQPAVVHPRPVHNNQALPEGQDEEAGNYHQPLA